jgi:hypothetical protein
MKLVIFSLLGALALAQQPTPRGNSSSMTTSTAVVSTAANTSAADYTITALPAVTSQPACIVNCLLPIGLDDPSGCDEITNECACLSAPSDALDALTSCIQVVCQSSTSAYAAIATSLYESYCQSVFGTAEFSQAFSSEAAAASTTTTTSANSTPTKSESVTRTPSL